MESYTFPGNCYEINSTQNNFNYSKIVSNKNDSEFEVVESCPESKIYKIYPSGECINKCPTSQIYYSYTLNTSFDIEKQEESSMGILYPLFSLSPPRYLFNWVCYSSCPYLTYSDSTINECLCIYGWHYNSTIQEKKCYDHKNYCLSLEYYYHTDTKECVLSDCKEGYFKMNFECYKGKCPKDTYEIPDKKCESSKTYCYINETYKTTCGYSKYNG